jgi:ATP-dependent 26S proteasome regulatory subunit
MLRSRYPVFYLTTNEEQRLIDFLDHYCRVKGYECYLWDAYNGLIDLSTLQTVAGETEELKNNPLAILDYIISQSKTYESRKTSVKDKKDKGTNGIVYVLLDYFRFMTDMPDIERRFKAITDISSIVSTIVTGPYYQTTDVLTNLIPVLDFPLANKAEIKNALHKVSNGVSRDIPDIIKKTKKMEEDLINSASGLTIMEAQTAFSKSLVAHHDWNLETILKEKRQIISKSGMLEYFAKPVPMDDVGGLKRLVKWIDHRRLAFSEEAEKYGLKKPKGLLTIGMPGCVTENTKIKIKKISKVGKHKIFEE